MKTRITIKDLRAERGGDPDAYRRLLLTAVASTTTSTPTPIEADADADASDSNTSSGSTTPASAVDEALAADEMRREALRAVEERRSRATALQRDVIAPKKKAGGECAAELETLKALRTESGDWERRAKAEEVRRDGALGRINDVLRDFSPAEEEVGGDGAVEKSVGGKDGDESTTKSPDTATSVRDSSGSASSSGDGDGDGDGSEAEGRLGRGAPERGLSGAAPPAPSNDGASDPLPADSGAPVSTSVPSLLHSLTPEYIRSVPPERILNLNVGVLGHVDTGKTSLVKTLSSVLSTAALDKSKQSMARGITLDLGFSAFLLPLPPHLAGADAGAGEGDNTDRNSNVKSNVNSNARDGDGDGNLQSKYDLLQVTLVDCPGHASLIRTIIGGAQIIDMVLLVVDATKGMQTQTAECLVIAEMTTRNLIVVLNKADLFPEHERAERLKKVEKKMRAALKGTRFEDAQMVGISACVGGEKAAAGRESGGMDGGGNASGSGKGHPLAGGSAATAPPTQNISGLLSLLTSQMRPPRRDARPSPERFHFAVDHCFPIKGQGTVLTGTCLSGSARPNDMIEFPTLATQKKIKGLQVFRRRANTIRQGDRAGICVTNLDARLMERGICAAPGTVKLIRGAIAVVRKVRFFGGTLKSGAKFHVSVGHSTVMATAIFWGAREIRERAERLAQEEIVASTSSPISAKNKNGNSKGAGSSSSAQPMGNSSLGGTADLAGLPHLKFDWNEDFLQQDDYLDVLPRIEDVASSLSSSGDHGGKKSSTKSSSGAGDSDVLPPLHWACLEFHTPVYCPMDSLVIGSRLDTDVNANACRLAFSGRLVERYDPRTDQGRVKTYTRKEKSGVVCRLGDPHRRNDDNKIVRYEVFGTDLFKKETAMSQFVGLLVETDRGEVGSIQSSFGTSGKFRVGFPGGTEAREGDVLHLRFKRYANDPKKAMRQDGALPHARVGTRLDPPLSKKKKKAGKKDDPRNESRKEVKNGKNGDGNQSKLSETKSTSSPGGTVVGEIVKLKGELTNDGNATIAIISGFFGMEDDISKHKGRNVISSLTNEKGVVDSSFGKVGKCKVLFKDGISAKVGSKVDLLPT